MRIHVQNDIKAEDLPAGQADVKPRKPVIAFFLSLFTPGLGQVYNGQPKKAALFFGSLLLLPVLFRFTKGQTLFYGLIALVTLDVFITICLIADAIIVAKRQKEYLPKKYNTWYYHLLIAALMLGILWVYDVGSVMGIQSFRISTSSNNPTFQAGDRVVADLNAYDSHAPGYGDIVVFNSRRNGVWTFRVVGLPGDKLALTGDFVVINGKQCKTVFVRDSFSDETPVSEYIEELPNGHRHRVFINKTRPDPAKSDTGDIIVAANACFLLGDNRDNAADSRYIGTVDRKQILGRVIYSFWGKTKNRINIDFRNQ